MITQVEPNGRDTAKTPSRTEGRKAVVESAKKEGLSNNKNKTPSYKATGIREQSPKVRALRVAELRKSLASLEDKISGRLRAKRDSILYSLGILCK